MAVYCTTLESDEDVFRAVQAEVELTHPNEVAVACCYTYVLALRHLLLSNGDKVGAFKKVEEYIKESGKAPKMLRDWWTDLVEPKILRNGTP